MRIILLLLIPVALLFAGCNVINPAEPVPTYIRIDSFSMNIAEPSKQGTAAQDFSSVWIYYNNNPVGVFDLPCTVPVITEGEQGTISVAPGITLNGLVDLQPLYNFTRFDTVTLMTNPGGVFHFQPVTSYIAAANFPYKEDFEVGNSFEQFIPGEIGDTALGRTTDPSLVFEGGGSAYVRLTTAIPKSENISTKEFEIPIGESFLEIHYRCSVPFEVGLYNTLSGGVDVYEPIAGVKPSETWKKMYIDLATYRGKYPGTNYRVWIKAFLPEGATEGYVLLDNFKAVTY